MIGFLKEFLGVEAAKDEPRKINPAPWLKRDMVDAVRGRGFKTVTREALKKEMQAACDKSSAKRNS